MRLVADRRLSPDVHLLVVSSLVLFTELAFIRWFPAHVLFLTFFTNTVLLACFLGMSVGCLAAGHGRNHIRWTPALILLATGVGASFSILRPLFDKVIAVGNQNSPEMVYFGAERYGIQATTVSVPIEVILAFFFVALAAAFIGPGQELGRAINQVPGRVRAYTLNIAGSLVGIGLFALFSVAELPPVWWFVVISVGVAYLIHPFRRAYRPSIIAALCMCIYLANLTSGPRDPSTNQPILRYWSPYYRIDYLRRAGDLAVNLIGHQEMVGRNVPAVAVAYEVPYLLRRDSAGAPFKNVLIIGAGTGNDVSRALQWGAERVDAVEIDPVIYRIGRENHPDRPYDDPRVVVHLDDGRNFLRETTRQYDLIIFALVDSLVLHSGYSDVRLESFLFTPEAFQDVHRHLRPGGVVVMYNYFRQGWIVARLGKMLASVFGSDPLVFPLPYRSEIAPSADRGFTILMAGDTQRIQQAFSNRLYGLALDEPLGPASGNGFSLSSAAPSDRQIAFIGPAHVEAPKDLSLSSDEWPFLYLRKATIPGLHLRGIAVMGILGLCMVRFVTRGHRQTRITSANAHMFFLGAGFMLIETKAVVQMALLFGSTWMVNTMVFAAVLVMILAANLFVSKFAVRRLWPYYVALFVCLAANVIVPMSAFLGLSRALRMLSACSLVFSPMLFAGVIFATAFARSSAPNRDFGMNVGGALVGGLSEYSSMLLGFKYLGLVTIAFYAGSALVAHSAWTSELREERSVCADVPVDAAVQSNSPTSA